MKERKEKKRKEKEKEKEKNLINCSLEFDLLDLANVHFLFMKKLNKTATMKPMFIAILSVELGWE